VSDDDWPAAGVIELSPAAARRTTGMGDVRPTIRVLVTAG
jgi:hypothetical protein